MKILALETSAKAVSAAISQDGKILCAGYQDTGLTHSRTLMPIVEHLFKNSGLTLADMDAVAVAAGPGSFTGIRIGVSAAKGLAFGADKPVAAVSTLSAMARGVSAFEGLIICAMDARRSQIYNALFSCRDGVLTRLCEDRAIALDELAAQLQDNPLPKIVVGDGAQLCFEALSNAGISCRMAPPQSVMQNAMGAALEAEVIAANGGLQTPQALEPVYLRPAQADRLRQK